MKVNFKVWLHIVTERTKRLGVAGTPAGRNDSGACQTIKNAILRYMPK
jgi:hypothetical protein